PEAAAATPAQAGPATKLTAAVPALHAAYQALKKPYAPRELERIEAVLYALAEGRVLPSSDPNQRPSEVLVPGLTAPPLHDAGDYPWMSQLESAWQEMRREAQAIGEDTPSFAPYGIEFGDTNIDPKWRAFYFHKQGVPNRENLARCPRTGALVSSLLPKMSA